MSSGKFRKPLVDRFWSKVRKTPECWLWDGATPDPGYGHILKDGVMVGAHRVSWEISFGDIPEGMHVLHKCDVRRCVNPDHLFLGTNADNMADRNRKGRSASGERNGRSKITFEKARRIRSSVVGGVTQTAVAKSFGVSRALVCLIVNQKIWREI